MKRERQRLQTIDGFLLSALLATLAAVPSWASEPAAQRADQLLQAVLENDGLPSLSVAVGKDGEIVYSRALGWADLENRVPASLETAYAIGSVTKTFTAVLALRLIEMGKLDPEARVQAYCAEFPEKAQRITTSQLLAHTSGIRHYDYRRFAEDYLNTKHYDSIGEALTKFGEDDLVAEPGAKYHYSSWGYTLAGCALEGAGGRPYSGLLESLITEPLGLEQTRPNVVADLVPHRARGYSKAESGALSNAGFFDPSDRWAAGGLLSAPIDMVRFANALMGGELLEDESLERMWSSAELSSGEPTGEGLGWRLDEESRVVHHGGTTVGGTAFLYLDRARHLTVAIAVNLSLWDRDRHELARDLSHLFSEASLSKDAQ